MTGSALIRGPLGMWRIGVTQATSYQERSIAASIHHTPFVNGCTKSAGAGAGQRPTTNHPGHTRQGHDGPAGGAASSMRFPGMPAATVLESDIPDKAFTTEDLCTPSNKDPSSYPGGARRSLAPTAT